MRGKGWRWRLPNLRNWGTWWNSVQRCWVWRGLRKWKWAMKDVGAGDERCGGEKICRMLRFQDEETRAGSLLISQLSGTLNLHFLWNRLIQQRRFTCTWCERDLVSEILMDMNLILYQSLWWRFWNEAGIIHSSAIKQFDLDVIVCKASICNAVGLLSRVQYLLRCWSPTF